jgi:(p)ppGpp synthase/HD superfamily hydrolase
MELTMKREKGYSEQYEQALRVATVAHRYQTRKGSGLPYVIHPIHVSVILLRHGFSTEAVIAGLLHDVVEDQGYELGEIEGRFGAPVAEMVKALSERKSDAEGVKRPWELRKREALQQIREASLDAVAVKCADTLHNAHSFVQDLRREGVAVWEHFNRGPQLQLNYYRRVLDLAEERLGAHPLVAELAGAVAELARTIDETSNE